MQQHLQILLSVQKIDLGVRQIELQLAALPSALNTLKASAADLRKNVDTLQQEHARISKELEEQKEIIKTETQRIKKWSVRLNELKHQREYLALSREIEGAKRAQKDAETRISELNTEMQSVAPKLEEAQDKFAVVEIDCDTESQRVEKDSAALLASIQAETSRRNDLTGGIPTSLLKKYDTIRAKRLGIGLVKIADGCCSGCNMRLPPQLYNTLQRGASIEQCPSCNRLMFWEQPSQTSDEISH